MARKPKHNPDAWVEQVAEAPRAEVPEHRTRRNARAIRTYLRVSAFGFVPVLFLVIVLLGNSVGEQEEPPAPSVNMTLQETQARAVAMETVATWLAAEPSPLPTGRLLTWDGASKVPAAPPPEDGSGTGEEPLPMDVHRMTLVTASGSLFTAEVSVETSNAGAVVAGGPSLIPYTPTPEQATNSAWPGVDELQAPGAVVDAVDAWSRAFTSGDPSQLRLLVADEDATHSYVPLPAVELLGIEVRSTGPAPGAVTTDSDGGQLDPDVLMVRADLTLAWPGQDPSDRSPSDFAPSTFDLLVVGADTASPRVVAWGGPGSGPTLTQFGNAVAGVEINAQDTEESEPLEDTEETD